MAKEQVIEGRAIKRFYSAHVGNVRRGDKVVASIPFMRHLVEIGVVELVNPTGPTETKPAGPAETKEKGGAAGKKSSGAPTDGRSISSPSSSAPGLGIASLFSAAVRPLLTATACAGSGARNLIATVGRLRSSR